MLPNTRTRDSLTKYPNTRHEKASLDLLVKVTKRLQNHDRLLLLLLGDPPFQAKGYLVVAE